MLQFLVFVVLFLSPFVCADPTIHSKTPTISGHLPVTSFPYIPVNADVPFPYSVSYTLPANVSQAWIVASLVGVGPSSTAPTNFAIEKHDLNVKQATGSYSSYLKFVKNSNALPQPGEYTFQLSLTGYLTSYHNLDPIEYIQLITITDTPHPTPKTYENILIKSPINLIQGQSGQQINISVSFTNTVINTICSGDGGWNTPFVYGNTSIVFAFVDMTNNLVSNFTSILESPVALNDQSFMSSVNLPSTSVLTAYKFYATLFNGCDLTKANWQNPVTWDSPLLASASLVTVVTPAAAMAVQISN